ncbi:hypothetical protein EXIGLDRAFT_833074 [Exidia glandulosa HHB12029]|uniref:Uncharacterized protein n=1 Tax=Exidia glandulosa HHB12029 TaxID=1314781 RepID=A0A165L1W5_EXIGL|nr:hypothetical protein EXIGLDRAFT_833074 [Exidia glandulosa HHB12029]
MSTAAHSSRHAMEDVSNARVDAPVHNLKRPRSGEDADDDVPDGHVAINGFKTELWSSKALELANSIGEESDKRNPDLHDMHVYGRFFTYGLYDLVETKLKDWGALFKKDPSSMDTWYALEAITFFIATLEEGDFSGIDDEKRFYAFVHVFCAAWHTLAKHLHTAGRLARIPNASNVLLTAAKIVDNWLEEGGNEDMPTLVRIMLCRDGLSWANKSTGIMGENGEKPGDEPARKKKKTSSADTRIEQLAQLDVTEAEKEYRKARAKTYEWSTVWKKYAREYAGLTAPIQGANGFDITKWPAAVRARYSLDRHDNMFGF